MDVGNIIKPKRIKVLKSKIAKYWLKTHMEGMSLDKIEKDPFLWKLLSQDWGEPSCWACGMWENDSDATPEELQSKSRFWQAWNRAKFLVVCHIKPHALTGDNDPSNLLLLCHNCHDEFCDIGVAKYMKQMVAEQSGPFTAVSACWPHTSDLKENGSSITKYMNMFGVTQDMTNYCIQEENKEHFFEWYDANTVPVGGKCKDSTRIAAIAEYCELYMPKDQGNEIANESR